MFNRNHLTKALCFAFIVSIVAVAGVASAEPRAERDGFFAGLDLGAGGSGFEYDRGAATWKSDDDDGAAVGLRVGYAFNPYFALAVNFRGYHHEDDGIEYSMGTTTLNAIVYPTGGGLFLSVGGGPACFELDLDDAAGDPLLTEIDEEGGALAFGIGYEWMLNERFALGAALEMRGAAFEDFDDIEDLRVGESTLGVTMNYFF